MKPNKSIERLFQESFKDFQASPSPKVWNGIENVLPGKSSSKRVLPFWWQAASVAAILLIFMAIGAFYYNPIEPSSSSVSSLKNAESKSTSNSLEVIPSRYRFSAVNQNLSSIENSFEQNLAFQIKEPEVTNTQGSANSSFGVTSSEYKKRLTEKSISSVNQLNSFSINSFSASLVTSSLLENETISKIKKKSLFDDIEEEEVLALVESNTPDKPWAIQPNIAPVFMNSFNGGNPVEPSLQGKTSSNPNMSYGVNIAYAIRKNIKIRTGINQVAMGYNTQNVVLSINSNTFQSQNSSPIISSSGLVGNATLISASSARALETSSRGEAFGTKPTYVNSTVGAMNHELGFVEVPVEVEYSLLDQKIGIHLLGGASTYLLNNNEVFFEENGRSSSIGEANNLNTFSFSANLGVGMDYNFSERVSFNLEPKFMYQINTFRSNTDTFQPYFFGIYSGIKFKF